MRIFLVISLFAAFSQTADIIDTVIANNYYAEGLSGSEDSALASAARGSDVFIVILQGDVPDTEAYADRVLNGLSDDGGTVVVLTPREIAAVSGTYSSAEIDRAIDASISLFDDDYAAGFRAFEDALFRTNAEVATTTPAVSSGSGGSGFGFLVFLLGGGVLIGFFVWRSKKKKEIEFAEDLEEAREEVRSQIGAIANDILEFADRVTMAENDEVTVLYTQATATFADMERSLEVATTLGAVEDLGGDLDEARWQLDAVEAKLEGRIPPPKPVDRPAHCFFDPTHRAGTEEGIIKTAAGQQTVSVCRSCKSDLMRGDKPETRDINVGGRATPAPRAPKSYGGGGIGGLDVFNIIVGGANVAYDLRRSRGRPTRSNPPRSSGLGLPGGLSNRSSSRSSNRSSSRGTSSRSRSSRSRSSSSRGRSSRRRR